MSFPENSLVIIEIPVSVRDGGIRLTQEPLRCLPNLNNHLSFLRGHK